MKSDENHERALHGWETAETARVDPMLLSAVREAWHEIDDILVPPPCPAGDGNLRLDRRGPGPWVECRPESVGPETFLPHSEFVSQALATGALPQRFASPQRQGRPLSGLLAERLAHLTAKRRAEEPPPSPKPSSGRLTERLELLRERRAHRNHRS